MFIVVENVKFVELNICDTCYFKLILTRYKKRLHKYLKKIKSLVLNISLNQKTKFQEGFKYDFIIFFVKALAHQFAAHATCVYSRQTPLAVAPVIELTAASV